MLALAGALSCAELSASLPYAGGDYIYLREAYGRLTGFLSGWSSFFVTFSGSVASLAVGFAAYAAFFFPIISADRFLFSTELFGWPLRLSVASGFSILVVIALSGLHCVGVRQGASVLNVLTVLKIGALLGIILLAVLFGNGDAGHFSPFLDFSRVSDWTAFGAAFIPIIFAYAGWNVVIYLAGEVKQPERNLPRALLWANLLVIGLYLAVNAVYIYALPVDKMQGTLRISEAATTALFGQQTSAWITAIITVSILGALNVTTMAGPRIYYAMARDGLFFRGLTRVHPRFETPSNAIMLQALWSCILILTGTFDQLFTYVSVMIALFSALAVGSVMVLRVKRPELHRPYRTWGYPFLPLFYILANVGIALDSALKRPWESLGGVLIVGLGIPAYFFWSRSKSAEKQPGE